ncbi:hypothetical protein [Saccharopolyspora pogona]|uniref:hypothetical protein n=1 Tax=Saccharopolyspora pogona TaxID=333966 RepID=UPI001687D254|nr:hypothetical protein [Saccharopolyspora pogona]
MCGASADGRLLGQPIASDLSPAPSPVDQPVDYREAPFSAALDGFSGEGSAAMWNVAPTDFNIREDFPLAALTDVIRAFARGSRLQPAHDHLRGPGPAAGSDGRLVGVLRRDLPGAPTAAPASAVQHTGCRVRPGTLLR